MILLACACRYENENRTEEAAIVSKLIHEEEADEIRDMMVFNQSITSTILNLLQFNYSLFFLLLSFFFSSLPNLADSLTLSTCISSLLVISFERVG